jgi:uncharacterized DUF497 family protein
VYYEFDPDKDRRNIAKHRGVSLADVDGFDWETARIRQDSRQHYPEARFEAIGCIEDRVYVLVFCLRGEAVRIISLRKANLREVKRYAAEN